MLCHVFQRLLKSNHYRTASGFFASKTGKPPELYGGLDLSVLIEAEREEALEAERKWAEELQAKRQAVEAKITEKTGGG